MEIKSDIPSKVALSAWETVLRARHTQRPHSKDYIEALFHEPDYIQGDKMHGDDPALLGGWADFLGQPIAFLGQQKGRTIAQRMEHNSGMMHPEGYRKALRIARMAEKFQVPLIAFIDTPGAYPGIDAEKRGQSFAIAENLKIFSQIRTPILNIVIGEGCSGGALGIGVGDCFLMMQYSYFSIISPEGCASILFKSSKQAPLAAELMGITAPLLLEHNLIDRIILEPLGGAHCNPAQAFANVRKAIEEELHKLLRLNLDQLVQARYERLMSRGEIV